MLRRLQDSPHFLEVVYKAVIKILTPFQRWLIPGGRMERLFIQGERLSKGALFDCRMCGQCILHYTGMTCPMTCPKNLRNGPCGGVRPNGHCEIKPEMPCVWVQAWERSKRMPEYGEEILLIQAPLNNSLKDTSAWINDFHQKLKLTPIGWDE
jgi:hypothetical protein